MGLPDGSDGKESAYNAKDLGLIPGLGRSPGVGYGNPLQYSCLENPRGQRSLTGYSTLGHKRVRHNRETKQQHKANILLHCFEKKSLSAILTHFCF